MGRENITEKVGFTRTGVTRKHSGLRNTNYTINRLRTKSVRNLKECGVATGVGNRHSKIIVGSVNRITVTERIKAPFLV